MTSRLLLQSLLRTEAYPHSVQNLTYTQTHLSYVLLTGDYAYKVKKPVNLGFQDFSSLAKRKHFCELECQLNQALAPDLYLGVVPITGTEDNPQVGGLGPVIEWAIKMHQFPETCLMANLFKRGEMTLEMIDDLARQAAQFHQQTPISHDGVYGTPQKVLEPMLVNFTQLRRLLSDPDDLDAVQIIETWAMAQSQSLQSQLIARKSQGFIRACHGDMHLGNAVLLHGRPTLFDCIEFNESFRWTDVMGDVGFMAMDLTFNNRADLANYFVNRYFEYTGDYSGAPLLRYYMSYRAMVRAKVAGFMMEQNQEDPILAAQCLSTCRAYLQLAKRLCQPLRTRLTITHGLSGTGKSTVTNHCMMQQGAVRLRSDVERKRLNNIPIFAPVPDYLRERLYTKEMSEQTFERLYQVANTLLSAHLPVIIDATFLKHQERSTFQALAQQLDVPFQILNFPTPSDEELAARLAKRAAQGNDASDACIEVAMAQKQWLEPLTEEELRCSIPAHDALSAN